jgi:CD109 antigen
VCVNRSQRELNYRHPDGSFSAFGTSDASGSTWLTAFVVKVFAQASEFVFVDPSLQAASVGWLQSQQGRDGAFASVGEVIHTEMQGGTASGVSLTAFVLTALLQARVQV